MRYIAILFTLFGSAASAQNWALLNPAYKYNYSNDGTDTISNQVFVQAVQPLGVDSFRYELNPIAEACAPCNGVPPGCASNAGVFVDRPQVFGLEAITYGPQWILIGADSLLVVADAGLGANWTGPEGIQGTVSSAAEEDLFGQLDSVKRIDYSNGASITISKVHGVTAFSANGQSSALIGVQGGLDAGTHFPEVIDLFDYQPGDILQYHGTDQGTDGMCFFSHTYTKKYEVLSRTDLPGHTDYALHEVGGWYSWGSPMISGAICSGGSGSYETTISLGIDHDHWTQDNFLGSCWLNQLWPQALAEPLTSGEFPGEFGSSEVGTQWRAYPDDQGRYVMEPERLNPDQPDMSTTLAPCFEDSTFWPVSWGEIMGRYVEGVGFTYGSYLGFEHASEKILEAYLIGGVEFGDITPNDIILGIDNQQNGTGARLSPNPASDQLQLASSTPGTACSILDMRGSVVASRIITSASEVVDVRPLQPGAYLLVVDGFAPQRFMIVR